MIVTVDAIPHASETPPRTELTIEKPKRSRLMRLLADSDLDWRAEACTKLLVRGWTNIHATEERVSAVRP